MEQSERNKCLTAASQQGATQTPDALPLVYAGPMLRCCTPKKLTIWLALREPVTLRLRLATQTNRLIDQIIEPKDASCQWIEAGTYLHYVLLDIEPEQSLPTDQWISYQLAFKPLQSNPTVWVDLIESVGKTLLYPGRDTLGFVLPSQIRTVLHGSCRKPHHPSPDGLLAADQFLQSLLSTDPDSAIAGNNVPDPQHWPSLLMLTGDQVYMDDVAGPMLYAIHQVIDQLGLPDEPLPGVEDPTFASASKLYRHPASFYRRDSLLPTTNGRYDLLDVLFHGARKPVFTTDSAHNHLITLAEMIAMYLLVWSPTLWERVDWSLPASLSSDRHADYLREKLVVQDFVKGLTAVRRLFAHLPTAMIFDDHDITDDWNLNREWEEVAYDHPFSRRVIGNALCAYMIHQGWGNQPDSFKRSIVPLLKTVLPNPGCTSHEELIHELLAFRQWHYVWPTSPPLVVIDTRTHRWRSERGGRLPSGLMDWESLTDLQQTLKGMSAVLLVSPTPIFGVKLIEVVQRVFSWFGKPLLVDAENWMAHPGAGGSILNIFRHPKTPHNFVVLSGDVHYSFVYDVELRDKEQGPDIWQICSSGIRNTFPAKLLDRLDLLNRWLYSPRSPLNWLTRRRRMRIIPRKPDGLASGRRLLNSSGIGRVELDEHGVPVRISQLTGDGGFVDFSRLEDESRWE